MGRVFADKSIVTPKGVRYAPGKADVTADEYYDKSLNNWIIFKLCENYDGRIRGGIRKTWRAHAQHLSLQDAKIKLAALKRGF